MPAVWNKDSKMDRTRDMTLGSPAKHILGNLDGSTCGHAYKKYDKQIYNRAGAAHGGKGVIAYIPTHNDAVNRVVKLLGNIAYKQRKGKKQDFFPGLALGHVHRGK